MSSPPRRPTRTHEPADERELVAAVVDGDRAAFDRLTRAHFGRVYALLFRMVGNHEDAEDLAQECFVRAWENLHHLRPEGSFGGWIARIALHLAHDHHRRRGRRPEESLAHGSDPEAAAGGPAAELTRRELVRAVGEALQGLPHGLRAALVLRVLEGRDYAEVARATGLRPGTVRTQVMKARRILMRRLAPLLERSRR